MKRAIMILMSLSLATALLSGCGAPAEADSADDMPSIVEDTDPRADGDPSQADDPEPAEGSAPEQDTPEQSEAPSAQEPTETKQQTEPKLEQKPAETKTESKPQTQTQPQTPTENKPAQPAPENTQPSEPETPAPAAAPTKADAAKYIGKSASSLRSALGAPKSTSYASSCLGDGEDGEWVYDGFTVYTYREGSTETVQDVD